MEGIFVELRLRLVNQYAVNRYVVMSDAFVFTSRVSKSSLDDVTFPGNCPSLSLFDNIHRGRYTYNLTKVDLKTCYTRIT